MERPITWLGPSPVMVVGGDALAPLDNMSSSTGPSAFTTVNGSPSLDWK